MPQYSDVTIVDVIISSFHLDVMIDRWHARMIDLALISFADGFLDPLHDVSLMITVAAKPLADVTGWRLDGDPGCKADVNNTLLACQRHWR